MNIIAVLNQKGGSGKTTIATHLARALQLNGADVLLVDSDPQGSARDWSAAREDQPLTVVGIDRPTIDRDIKNLALKVDFVIIDGAPQAADLAVSAIKAADLVLIPVQPSPTTFGLQPIWLIWSSNASRSRTASYELRLSYLVRSKALGSEAK